MARSRTPQWGPPAHLSCLTCKPGEHAEWCVLGTDQLQVIDSNKVPHRYKPGDYVYHQGETCRGVYCVEQGTLALRMTQRDGNSKILRIVDSGSTVGYADFFSGGPFRSSAVALDEATVCHVPAEPLRQVISHNPALGLAFLSHSSDDLWHADRMVMQQALHTVRMRLAYLLLSLKDRHGTAGADGEIIITLPMPWQDAAELIGARPETVSRSLQSLVGDGIVVVSGHEVTVPDLDPLLDEIEATGAE